MRLVVSTKQVEVLLLFTTLTTMSGIEVLKLICVFVITGNGDTIQCINDTDGPDRPDTVSY